MKSFIKIFVLLAALNGCATTSQQQRQRTSQPQTSVNFQVFYDELSPYGTWVDYPSYGYVWMPDEDAGFSPYATAGHWVFTDDGWTWVSDYPWGWAPFHYGRWDRDEVYGWFWVPDNQWGPAWVSWRSSPGYYGWAPLHPGVSITMAMGRDYRERNDRWNFVHDADMMSDDIGRHYIDRNSAVTIINNSTVIVNIHNDRSRNASYIAGPNREEIQQRTRQRIDPVVIRDNDRPGHRLSNGELQIYRPQVQNSNANGRNPSPSRVRRLNELRPSGERNAGNRQRDLDPSNNDRRDAQPPPPVVTPPVVTPQPGTGRRDEHPTPPVGNPSDNGRRDQHPTPPVVNPPVVNPPVVNPPGAGRRDRQPVPPVVTPPGTGRRDQQPLPPVVAPPAAGPRNPQPAPPVVAPPDNGRRDQRIRSREALPPAPGNRNPQVKPGEGNAPKPRGREKQQEKIVPPPKAPVEQPEKPKPDPDEKKTRRREE